MESKPFFETHPVGSGLMGKAKQSAWLSPCWVRADVKNGHCRGQRGSGGVGATLYSGKWGSVSGEGGMQVSGS